MTYDVIVVGGGPAGMFAAATAAGNGSNVLIIEKNERFGRKLMITGKGRCNLTNDCSVDEFFQNIPQNPRFLMSSINRFAPEDAISFFESRNVPVKTERGNRVFPVSDRAVDIVDSLVLYVHENNVECRMKISVSEVLTENGEVTGVVLNSGERVHAPNVIIATGGMSYPTTGSTGDGYRFAEASGHTLTEIRPSLIPIETMEDWCAHAQGLSLRNVTLTAVDEKGKTVFSEMGEMLFTHYGVSGPLVLSASAHLRKELKSYKLIIDLKPALDEATLDDRILRDFSKNSNKDFGNSLDELLPKKLIPIVIRLSGISSQTKVNQITKDQRKKLVHVLKNLTITPWRFRPIEEAIITSGGVSVKEINPKTMESKLIRGLYFAGEIIDVDGYTGGFNLQIAYATGITAGLAASGGM